MDKDRESRNKDKSGLPKENQELTGLIVRLFRLSLNMDPKNYRNLTVEKGGGGGACIYFTPSQGEQNAAPEDLKKMFTDLDIENRGCVHVGLDILPQNKVGFAFTVINNDPKKSNKRGIRLSTIPGDSHLLLEKGNAYGYSFQVSLVTPSDKMGIFEKAIQQVFLNRQKITEKDRVLFGKYSHLVRYVDSSPGTRMINPELAKLEILAGNWMLKCIQFRKN